MRMARSSLRYGLWITSGGRQAGRARQHIVVGIAGREQHLDVRTQLARALRERRAEHAAGHHHVGEQQIDVLGARAECAAPPSAFGADSAR